MNTKLPNLQLKRSPRSTPKVRLPFARKSARLRGFLADDPGQCWPGHWPGQPGPPGREQGPFPEPAGATESASRGARLGMPLNIGEVARLIGCSPWTVRQTLIPRGLPHFRFRASGRLIFYRDQVIRWIENQQQGGNQ